MSRFNDLLNKKAVALKYDERQSAAPVVVASGMGYMAEKMVEIANDSGVPVYEDNSLATVLSQLNLGTEIPEELYKAVVDIYAYFLHFVPGSVAVVEEQGDGGTPMEDAQGAEAPQGNVPVGAAQDNVRAEEQADSAGMDVQGEP